MHVLEWFWCLNRVLDSINMLFWHSSRVNHILIEVHIVGDNVSHNVRDKLNWDGCIYHSKKLFAIENDNFSSMQMTLINHAAKFEKSLSFCRSVIIWNIFLPFEKYTNGTFHISRFLSDNCNNYFLK